MKYLNGSFILDPAKRLRIIRHIEKRQNRGGFGLIDLDLEDPKTGEVERIRNFPYNDFVAMYKIPDRYVTEVLYARQAKLDKKNKG